MSLLGLDIGTSGCKASIVNYDGNLCGAVYKEYFLKKPYPGWEELEPEIVWESVKEILGRLVSGYKGDAIKAISVSSFGEACVPIDKNGKALYNGIIYIDARGADEAVLLKEGLGDRNVLEITGASIHPMYSICKLMWLKKNMPEVYRETWKFLLFADYVLYKLGAAPHTDYSLAARTLAFDVVRKEWSGVILDFAGIDMDKFGKPLQSGTVVGEIRKDAAAELGLPEGALLVAGGHDQPCAALGAGAITVNTAIDGLGTVECITPCFDRPVISGAMAESSFACVPHVIKDMYVTYAFTFTSGSLLKWYRDNFGQAYKAEALKTGRNVYDIMIDNALGLYSDNLPAASCLLSDLPSALFVLPHFAGAATPYMDTTAKGAVVGLDINTRDIDIIRAILEGITYEMMINLEKLEAAGIHVDELRAVGGLAKSERFLQLKADMMGKKVVSLVGEEAGTLGVAILAGTASGVYESFGDGVARLVRKKKEYYPDSKLHQRYMEKFQTYKKIYPSVKGIYT